MAEAITSAGRMKGITATNGVTYGPARMAAAWGSIGCPIVPRAHRDMYGDLAAPKGLRDLAGDQSLTLGYLDRGIWNRLPVDELPRKLGQDVSREIGRLEIPSEAVAIPAGLPLAWVAELPIRTRTKNAIARLVADLGRSPLEYSLAVKTIMDLRSVGTATLIDLLCVIESGELGSRALQPMEAGADESCSYPVKEGQQRLSNLATWALSETDAVTLGDALAMLVGKERAVREWRSLAELRLRDISEHARHPYEVLDDWVSGLPERESFIFTHRIANLDDRPTLEKLGKTLGLTRERVRQVEKVLQQELRDYLGTKASRSVRWRIDSVRRCLGVAAPASQVDRLLTTPVDSTDYSSLLLDLAGPYVNSSGWLVLHSALESDPTPSILEMTDECGRIDMVEGGRLLSRWGIDTSLHSAWLTRHDKVRMFNGQLIRWRGPIADKLAFALDEMGSPLTPLAMIEFMGVEPSIHYVKNVLSSDDRFVRVNMTEFALTRWGLPEYRGVASSIRRILDEIGSMRIDDVSERLHTDFGTVRSTARAYCDAPAFVVEEGWVRLRREGEPYEHRGVIRDTAGVFGLGKSRVGILLEVDRDVLRGSGRSLGGAAGNTLGIQPRDRLTFRADDGISLNASFPDTSIQGPMLGSTRVFAGSMGLELGDYLTLILDRTRMSVSATGTRLADHSPGWPLVSRLTGINPSTGAEGLAAALDCDPGEVESVLRSRGDHVVADALPSDPG